MPPIYDDYYDECDIFSPPTIEEKVYYDYDMPPIYDDYNDDYECFTPTITNEKDFTYVESNNNTFMHVNHDKNALYDTYVVQFVHDGTEIYYERGKHVSKYLNNTMFPLFMLKVLMLHLLYLPMLITICFIDLFSYKIPMHRKWIRLKSVSYFSLDAHLCVSILIPM